MEDKVKKLKNNKTLKIIMNIIRVIIIVILAAFVLVVCMQRFSNNKLSLLNHRLFAVVTGSMEPKYKVGDVLISKDIDPSKIKVGDTISYLGNNSNFYGKVITHEVISIEKDIDGKLVFHTKGIANLVEDPVVKEDQIFGIVVYKTIILSLVYKTVSSDIGFYLFIIVPIFYIIGSEILSTLLEKKEEKMLHK